MDRKMTGLEPMIRKVAAKNVPHKPGDETVVTLLLNPERNFWEFKNEAFYLASRYPSQDCNGRMTMPIEEFSSNMRIDLGVEYRVRMVDAPFEATAKKVVEALYDENGPQFKLERLIRSWIEHYVEKVGGAKRFIIEYFEQESKLREYLQRAGRDQLSLDLHLQIRLLPESPVKETFELPTFTVKATFQDYDHTVDLKIDAMTLDLSDDPKERIFAYVRNGQIEKLTPLLQKKLLDTIRKEYKLHQFRGINVPASIKQALRDSLRSTAADFGRTIRVFDVRCETSVFNTKEIFESGELSFPISVPDYTGTEPPKVMARLQLELSNLSVFAESGISSMQDWARETLGQVIVPRLSRHTYLQLADLWDEERKLIDGELESKAAAIGYRWIHSTISTNLPFDLVRRPFEINVRGNVTTSNSESKVDVVVNALVRMNNIALLAETFPSEINIVKRLEESVLLVVRQVAKEHSPKDWYLNFEAHKDLKRLPVKTIVHDAIQEHLLRAFGGSILTMNITRGGDLEKRLNDLREQTPDLDFDVTRAKYRTKLAYRVLDADEAAWPRFEAAKPDIQKLTERITLHIQQMFADDEPAAFRRRSNGEILRLLNDPLTGVAEVIRKQYGLVVYIDHWIRESIDIETQIDTIGILAERTVLDTQQLLLESTLEENKLDVELIQQQKRAIRERISKLNVLDDVAEIKGLEDRLEDLETKLADRSSAAHHEILTKRRIQADLQLAGTLAQDVPKHSLLEQRQLGETTDEPAVP